MTKFDVWTLRAARALFCGAIALTLAACGGGGGSAGTPVVGPGSGASSPSSGASAVAADLVVVLSKNTLNNSTSPADSITATVTSIDANRVAVGSVPVSFSADANAVVTPAGTATNSTSGILTATITQGSDASVRPVNLTVKAGSVSRVVTFNVVQASSTTNPQASDISLTLSATSIDDSDSKATVVATATAVDANRNALSGIPVQLSVTDASASIVVPSTQTDANGRVTGTVSIGQDRTNRPITVTATSGTLVRTAAFQVTGAKFKGATPLPAVVPAGGTATVSYTLSDSNENALAGVPISVSGTGGVASQTGKTDLNGNYVFRYTAPNTPGATLVITAQAAGAEASVLTIPILGGTATVPAAATPTSTTLNLSANVVAVNSAQTNNQVSISAFFRDGSNAPVPNVRVLFGVTGDNQTGKIGSENTTVLSDASGAASGTYAPGAVSSPTNGVSILACWKTTDFAATDKASGCSAAGGTLMTTPLTIVSNPVSISIGTDNKIAPGPSSLTYLKKYVVLVVDSAGNPKAGVQVTPSVDLGGYGKGAWEYNAVSSAWERRPDFGKDTGFLAAMCPNEDLNRNGVIDSGEDVNGSQQLDPRKSDVSITLVGSTTTDANGVAVLQLEYPQNIASWVKYKITVTAAGVLSPPAYFPLGQPVSLPSRSLSTLLSSGSTAVEDYLYTYDWLPVNAADLSSKTVAPAFANSPYGVAAGCTNSK